MLVEVMKLRGQLRNWQRTLKRLEDKIVTTVDEISDMGEENYNEVMDLWTRVKIWNDMCLQIEDQIDDTYERVVGKGNTYRIKKVSNS